MHILCKRSGGVAGIRPVMTIDTDQLPPDEAKYVEDMVNKIPLCPPPHPTNPDRFSYHVVVEQDGQKPVEHCFGEGQNSPLINALFQAAKHTAEAIQKDVEKTK